MIIKQDWRYYGDLVVLGGLCALAGVLASMTLLSPLRLLCSVAVVFFVPGYALLSALYPAQKPLGQVQRLAASIGLSVTISGLLGLVTAYSLGISMNSVFLVLAGWTLLMSVLAGYRRHLTPASERFALCCEVRLPIWGDKGQLQKWMCLAQVSVFALLVLAAGRLLWISSHDFPRFAEFYLLDKNGLAGNYPEDVTPGGLVRVTVGVINHGKVSTAYDLFHCTNNSNCVPVASFVLGDMERWESEVEVQLPETLERQKITFALHKARQGFPYRTLHIWVNDTMANPQARW